MRPYSTSPTDGAAFAAQRSLSQLSIDEIAELPAEYQRAFFGKIVASTPVVEESEPTDILRGVPPEHELFIVAEDPPKPRRPRTALGSGVIAGVHDLGVPFRYSLDTRGEGR